MLTLRLALPEMRVREELTVRPSAPSSSSSSPPFSQSCRCRKPSGQIVFDVIILAMLLMRGYKRSFS
jgi:hypothetical protein